MNVDVTHSIKRNSYEPLFYRTKNNLQEMIKKNNLKPSDKIPNEEDLCALFKVSRTTIRRAIAELVTEGVLYRDHPKGTFVAEPKLRLNFIGELTSFAQEVVSKGLDLTDKILISKTTKANSFISDKLNIDIGENVYNFLRLRFVQNNSICLVDSHVNSRLCPDLDMSKHKKDSLYNVLEKKYGLSICKAYRSLEPIVAGKEEKELLGIDIGLPMLLICSTSFLEDGSVLEYYEAKIRGDRSVLALQIEKTGIINTT